LAHSVEHLVCMRLIKEAQLGNSHATGSDPAGDEHGTKAGFRDRTRAATASTRAPGISPSRWWARKSLDECSPWGASMFKARLRDGTEPARQRHDGRAHGVGGAAAGGRSYARRAALTRRGSVSRGKAKRTAFKAARA
jgi:hypothetical protein